jgi:radical SAM protein with 4Fe4S-binding SPASM domain
MRDQPREIKSYARRVRGGRAQLWLEKKPILTHLDLELTERCNNDCIHCYINLPPGDRGAMGRELSAREWRRLLEEAASLGCLSARFTGGEPLLREDFEEIYLSARRLGLRVTLFTNATLITPRLADLMARIHPLEKVEVSVYGLDKESCEAVTGVPGSFEAAMKGIRFLEDKGIPFVLKSAVLPPNRTEIQGLRAWAAEKARMEGPVSLAMFYHLRARRDSVEKNRRICGLRLRPDEGIALLSTDRKRYVGEMRGFFGGVSGLPGKRLFRCGAGTGGGCIDSYGRLQACLPLRHPETCYDVKAGSIRDALVLFFPKLREREASSTGYLSRCARCFLSSLCEQCPAQSWMEHGTLDTPVEYFCDIAHVQARDLGLLAEGERSWEVRDWERRIESFRAGI